MDTTYHYPPDLFNLLIDAIPRLNRTKNDLFNFFRGAGISEGLFKDLQESLPNKYEITRCILRRINECGDSGLQQRREILRRVTGFENFDSCYPNDRLAAKGLVASISELVNQKDAFTRINLERQQEQLEKRALKEKEENIKKEKLNLIQEVKQQLFSLFGAPLTPQERGKRLESVLNNLFKAYDISIKEAFHLVDSGGGGIIEQIDGVIGLDGHVYFVEMKWYKDPIGVPEISQHLSRLMARAESRGIFISASGYTKPGIHLCKDFLQHKVIILIHLEEIVSLLEQGKDLPSFLIEKFNTALVNKNPYHRSLTDTKV